MTELEERVRILEQQEVAATVQTRWILKELECLHVGIDDIKHILTNGLTTDIKLLVAWKEEHDLMHKGMKQTFMNVLVGLLTDLIKYIVITVVILGVMQSVK